jgi:hypothetical protein
MVSNKKIVLTAFMISGTVLFLVFLQTVFAWKAVKTTKSEYGMDLQKQSSPGWYNYEGNRLKKDILWFEQLLVLSKTDSIYMAIDLDNSMVQLGLKGMNLLESSLIDKYPSGFLAAVNEETYLQFAAASPVETETANFPKKPVRKVVTLNKQDDKSGIQNDANVVKSLRWTFTTANNLRVIITGVLPSADSSLIVNPLQDIVKYRLKEVTLQPVTNNYSPTLYLWMNDKEAKAIYRAVPPGGKVLFRY